MIHLQKEVPKLNKHGLQAVGFLPNLRYSMGQRAKPPLVSKHLAACLPQSRRDDLRRFKIQPATLASLEATLALYGRGDHIPGPVAASVFEMVMGYVDSIFKQANLSPQLLLPADFNGQAGPGAYFRLRGYKRKDQVIPLLTGMEGWFDPSGPKVVKSGCRARLIERGDEVDPVKQGRLVWEVDTRDVATLETYAKPLVEFLTGNHLVGSAVGLSNITRDMSELMLIHGHFMEEVECLTMDRRRYDSSIRRRFAARVLWSIRLGFGEEHKDYDAFWDYVLRSLCGNVILLPTGGCYLQTAGFSTGHPMVTSLETILTFAFTTSDIIMHRLETTQGNLREIFKEVLATVTTSSLGDDQLTSSLGRGSLPPLEWLEQNEPKNWGIELSIKKCWAGLANERPNLTSINASPNAPFFLGSFWVSGACWRSLWDLLMKLEHPEYSGMNTLDEIVRLSSYRVQWWTNRVAIQLLDYLVTQLMIDAIIELEAETFSLHVGPFLVTWMGVGKYWAQPGARYEHPVLGFYDPVQLILHCDRNWTYLCSENDAPSLARLSFQEASRVFESSVPIGLGELASGT